MSSASPASIQGGSPVAQPRRLGRYDVLVKVASGGMATVYLGRATAAGGFERLVAIKCCHPHLKDDEEFRLMFLDEARLAARIHHPNVVATLDVQDAEELFLVMEYVEGGRISDLTKAARAAGTSVPISAVSRCLFDALVGLHAAHTQKDADGNPLNIVHRDVSPHNLLVGLDGVTRVVDFGVAKAEARATITQDSRVKGKLAYMAPEQLGSKEVTARSDVFAAGIVLWEMLTGERCFRADSQSDLVQRVMFMPIPRPSTRRAEITPALEGVVMRALERNPAQRFAGALDFARALERCGVPMASHLEVADLVQRLLGPKLDQRRDALRTASRAAESGREAPTVEAPGDEGAPSQASAVVATAHSRRGRRTLWLAVGLVAALGTGALVLFSGADRGDAGAADRAPNGTGTSPVRGEPIPGAPPTAVAEPPPPIAEALPDAGHAAGGPGAAESGEELDAPREPETKRRRRRHGTTRAPMRSGDMPPYRPPTI